MNVSICLDQYASNYNLNALSSNGFNIYTDLDNFTTPIAQGIPYQNLFSAPIGNCPYLLTNVPAGATQLLVIDSCTTNPTLPGVTIPTSQELLIDCCYALIDIPQTPPPPFCVSCSLDFDVFSSSYVGQIVAGNLTSNCGSVTDYTIGWYKDGDYSSPEFVSGYGNAFLPYQNLHPLTGSSAVPAAAGDWEGIIHDIAINGVTYSSVSGSANGQPIPFESCFGTIVADPLTCNNGTFPGKYSHIFEFNSQAVGTTPSPVSLTYALDSTTKYFAYAFAGLYVWDELEIKFKSGNPSATSNPSLYSQPIYLEKLKIGHDPSLNVNSLTFQSTDSLPGSFPSNIFDGQYSSVNNTWPKSTYQNGYAQRVLTLTTLETSSNPSLPDILEITITPNPTNNNTLWFAGFQCLTNFDCTDCYFENYPTKLPKIDKVELDKIYGCDAQRLLIRISSSCDLTTNTSDWMGVNIGTVGITNPSINLINSSIPAVGINGSYVGYYPYNYIPLKGNTSCTAIGYPQLGCGPSSTGTITFNQTPGQIQLTFDNYNDYLHYKNPLYSYASTITSSIPCSGNTLVDYYKYFGVQIPIQGANANCGDSTNSHVALFHQNNILNVVYVENSPSNFWSITIPQTSMVNCYTPNISCDSCYNTIQSFINSYNSSIIQSFSFTTTVGAKYQSPFWFSSISKTTSTAASGSYCYTYSNSVIDAVNTGEMQYYSWYSTHTIPFISSSNGWVNLPSLGAFIPCSNKTGSYPIEFNHSTLGLCYAAKISGYSIRFPHLGGNGFNYSLSTNDFEIYAESGYGATGSQHSTQTYTPPPCPDPLSSLIYRYSGSTATVITSSHFLNGTTPILVIDP
jgi:hypothetical protein